MLLSQTDQMLIDIEKVSGFVSCDSRSMLRHLAIDIDDPCSSFAPAVSDLSKGGYFARAI